MASETAKGLGVLLENWQKENNLIGNMLPIGNADFEESIEPGVKKLVFLLINNYGWVTYTSCEGHQKTRLARNVRLVARTPEEANTIYDITLRAAKKTNALFRGIRIKVVSYVIKDQLDQKDYLSVSITFKKEDYLTYDEYFTHLNEVTDNYIQSLESV